MQPVRLDQAGVAPFDDAVPASHYVVNVPDGCAVLLRQFEHSLLHCRAVDVVCHSAADVAVAVVVGDEDEGAVRGLLPDEADEPAVILLETLRLEIRGLAG